MSADYTKTAARKSAPDDKSVESWIWDAACSIRGAKDAPKYKVYILPVIFTKRLCDVFDDEINRIAAEVGIIMSRVLAPDSKQTLSIIHQ